MGQSADVIVVGGGVIGLSCAWRLSQQGAKVVLLERRACGSGASRAALGALMPPSPTRSGPLPTMQRRSLWMFADFAGELRERSGIDIEYQRRGRWEVIATAQRRELAEREVVSAKQHWPLWADPAMELIEPDEARRRAPHVAATDFGALRCNATAQVCIPKLIHALVAACRSNGVQLHEGLSASGLRSDGDRVSGVVTADGNWDADQTLICAGAWTPGVSELVARYAPIRPVRGQGLVLAACDEPLEHLVRSPSCYLIRRKDGTTVVGATTEPQAGFDDHPTLGGAAELARGATALIPSLAAARFGELCAGLRPKSPDGKPFMGPIPGLEGLFVASGHYKTGIGLCPLTGQVMAEWLLERKPMADGSAFLPARTEPD